MSNGKRIEIVNAKLKNGEKYFDYLFKITEKYEASLRVYTGISAALLALPLFQLKNILLLVHAQPGHHLPTIIAVTGALLGFSVLAGAYYQSISVQIVEDEAEMNGKNYDNYISRLRLGYGITIILLMLGIVGTIIYLYMIFTYADPEVTKTLVQR